MAGSATVIHTTPGSRVVYHPVIFNLSILMALSVHGFARKLPDDTVYVTQNKKPVLKPDVVYYIVREDITKKNMVYSRTRKIYYIDGKIKNNSGESAKKKELKFRKRTACQENTT